MTHTIEMDRLMEGCTPPMGSTDIVNCVKQAFDIDLMKIPVLSGDSNGAEALEGWLERRGGRATGAEARQAVNEIFGVNLDALSALEGKRISLFSKGQWILRRQEDLFAVHTGTGDADVTITSTSHYRRLAGSDRLPDGLLDALQELGFRSDETAAGSCTYASPIGEAVEDAFKGRTIKTVLDAISRMKTET